MRRGLPPIGGAKPRSLLSFQNMIHPLPVIEEDSASHDEEMPRVPERSPMRVSPLTAARTHGPSTPRVTVPPPPLRSRTVLPLQQKTASVSDSGGGGGPYRTILPIQRSASGHGGGGSGPGAQQSEKADHSVKGWLAKRGGWYRFALMAVLAVCTIVAMTVGLVLGLRQRK